MLTPHFHFHFHFGFRFRFLRLSLIHSYLDFLLYILPTVPCSLFHSAPLSCCHHRHHRHRHCISLQLQLLLLLLLQFVVLTSTLNHPPDCGPFAYLPKRHKRSTDGRLKCCSDRQVIHHSGRRFTPSVARHLVPKVRRPQSTLNSRFCLISPLPHTVPVSILRTSPTKP